MINVAYTLGRILVPILFIVLGIQKLLNVDDVAKSLTGYVPLPAEIDGYLGGLSRYVALAYLIAAIEIIAGIMVLIGLKARWGALMLIVFSACSVFFVHHFWDMEGAAAVVSRMQALMYLSILGALLLIVAGGSGANALEGRPRA